MMEVANGFSLKTATTTSDHQAVNVVFTDGSKSLFHGVWLRDNCNDCRSCTPNGQRLYETWSLSAAQTEIKHALIQETRLLVQWRLPVNGVTESVYSARWLADHAYDKTHLAQRQASSKLSGTIVAWDASLETNVGLPQMNYASIVNGETSQQLQFLRTLRRFGFVVVRSGPVDDNAVMRLAKSFGHIRTTNYGEVFDVVARAEDNKNLADTSLALSPHTDNPYRNPTPGVQLLHCQIAAPGDLGKSTAVDGYETSRTTTTSLSQQAEITCFQCGCHVCGDRDGLLSRIKTDETMSRRDTAFVHTTRI
eukprot:m.576693 g.576693  ORF g.576693 m.576693 type:complete len:308 (-) comp22286_c0_seq3:2555-3478(-)